MSRRKIWIDSTQVEQIGKVRLKELVAERHTLCVGTNFVDMPLLLVNPGMTEEWLQKGCLVIEPIQTLDQMVSKPFYWQILKKELPECGSFEKAIKKLKNGEPLREMVRLFEHYKKEKWTKGPFAAPISLSRSYAEKLDVDPVHYVRTEILKKCKKLKDDELYSFLNSMYIRSIAQQHCCDATIIDGKLIDLMT